MGYFIGGSASVDLFDGDTLFATANTLLTSTFDIGVTAVDVRGGASNSLLGKYFHTSTFDLKLEDPLFKLDYIAKHVGSDIVIGGDALITETVSLTNGAGTVVNTPVAFGNYGIIGFVADQGSETWSKVTFTGKNFTYGSTSKTVCVKYVYTNSNARKLKISSNIIPSTIKLIMTAQLFAGDSKNPTSASKIGKVQIFVDRFLLDGKVTIEMSSTGTSKTPLNGSALKVDDVSCENGGYYASIVELIDSSNWYDTVYDLAVSPATVELSTATTTAQLKVKAVSNKYVAFEPTDYTQLTFTSSDVSKVTVSNTGLLTKVATTTTPVTITVAITNKNTVSDIVNVTAV